MPQESGRSWPSLKARQPRAPEAEAVQPALETALDAIGGAALIVGRSGEILRANTAARALLERDGESVTSSLAKTVTGKFTELLWDLTPLSDGAGPSGFLARLRSSEREGKLDDAVRAAARLWKLTRRQRQVLELVAHGLTNAVVAQTLEIGERTVEFHVSAVFDKAGVDSRAALIARLLDL
jgi:DNA-binding CsgD family transcriptional regulator